jgi:RHS repeat-associated protein
MVLWPCIPIGYDSFGNIVDETGDAENSITFAGSVFDREVNLYYMNARYYDARIARFMTEDTFRGDPGDALSLNLYTYCSNNPLIYYDPTGHFKLSIREQVAKSHPDYDFVQKNGYFPQHKTSLNDLVGSAGGSVTVTSSKGSKGLFDIADTMTIRNGKATPVVLKYSSFSGNYTGVYSGYVIYAKSTNKGGYTVDDNSAAGVYQFLKDSNKIKSEEFWSSDELNNYKVGSEWYRDSALLEKAGQQATWDLDLNGKTELVSHINGDSSIQSRDYDQWADELYEKVNARVGKLPANIPEEFRYALVDEIIYEEAKPLQMRWSAIYGSSAGMGNPEMHATLDPLYTAYAQPNANPPNSTAVAFYNGFMGGLQVGLWTGAMDAGRTWNYPSRTFTSPDKYVGETANAIEAKYPGKVVGVNKVVKDSSGRILTDYDIELDNVIIQVKSGTAKGLTTQLGNTANTTDKTVIGYTPDLKPSSSVVKGGQKAGFDVYTNLDDLLNSINR